MQPQNQGLPVAGCRLQSDDAVALVNIHKQMEERLLRMLDLMKDLPAFDQRWLSIARTSIEQGFMAMDRAVFRPARIALPEDEKSTEAAESAQ